MRGNSAHTPEELNCLRSGEYATLSVSKTAPMAPASRTDSDEPAVQAPRAALIVIRHRYHLISSMARTSLSGPGVA